jgi:SAM-dependent methyltransferase
MSDRDDHTTLFRNSWSIYDAIAAENYMFHREIYEIVTERLRRRRESGPYTLLDLGCGNVRFLASSLRAAPPSRYDGVDLSATALAEARHYLDGLDGIHLHEHEMAGFVGLAGYSPDVIFTGYAVHHLPTTTKGLLFEACAAALAPGGEMLMVDVARGEGEDRDSYIAAYLGLMRGEWTTVPSAMIEEACDHVAAHDFPETLGDLFAMAGVAGFSRAELLDRHGPHHLMRFSI